MISQGKAVPLTKICEALHLLVNRIRSGDLSIYGAVTVLALHGAVEPNSILLVSTRHCKKCGKPIIPRSQTQIFDSLLCRKKKKIVQADSFHEKL